MTLLIEKNIPIPPRKQSIAGFTEALDTMEVGDSFHIPPGSFKTNASASSALSTYGRKVGKKYTSRKAGDGIRVWRTA